MAKLGEQKAYYVAPCGESSSELLLLQFPRDLRSRVRRDILAKLGEDAKLCSGWLFSFFHSPILGGIGGPATLNIAYLTTAYGMAVKQKRK